jgi:hypothetical protein
MHTKNARPHTAAERRHLVRKMDEVDALDITIKRLAEGG